MIVEIHGLELFGRHGVGEQERRDGQTFLVDVTLHVQEPAEDSVQATVDYRRARDVVRSVSDSRSFQLLETFAVGGTGRGEGPRTRPQAGCRLGRVDGR